MITALKAIETTSELNGLGPFSHMANFFAFLLNLKDIDLHISKLKLPVNRTAAGQNLRRYIKSVAQTLFDQCLGEARMVVDEGFLQRLGYDAIEIQLYLEDYVDAFAW